MLFGDTWIDDDFICQAPPPKSDDSLGWISLSDDDDPDDCLDIRFPAQFPTGDVKPLRVFDGLTELNHGRAPHADHRLERQPAPLRLLHRRAYRALCKPHQDEICPDGLPCNRNDVFCVDPGSPALARRNPPAPARA